MSLPEAVSHGSEAALRALLQLLAESLEVVAPEQRAPLAKQLRDTLSALEQVARPAVSASDEIAAQWAKRAAGGKPAATRRGRAG